MFKTRHREGRQADLGERAQTLSKNTPERIWTHWAETEGRKRTLAGYLKSWVSSQACFTQSSRHRGQRAVVVVEMMSAALFSAPLVSSPDPRKHRLYAPFFWVSCCLSLTGRHSQSRLWSACKGRDCPSHSCISPVGCWTVLANVWHIVAAWVNFHTQDSRVKSCLCQTLPNPQCKPSHLAHEQYELQVFSSTVLFRIFLIYFLNKIKPRPGTLS